MQKLSYALLTLAFSLSLSACVRSAPQTTSAPTALSPIANPYLPTSMPLQTFLPPTRMPGVLIASPTPNGNLEAIPTFTPQPDPNSLQFIATPTASGQSYIVQNGDYPSSIAAQFGITTEELLAANNLGVDAVIYPGDMLMIPVPSGLEVLPTQVVSNVQFASSDYFKIIPDSELIYGPLSATLDIDTFVQKQAGHLAYYTQAVDGNTLSGSQIVLRVAQNYSVNPRLLLAILEYRSQWVTNPNPAPSTILNPIGYIDDFHQGLYRQLTWTADMLNQGFYLWQAGRIQSWTLLDGSQVVAQPGINAGTAGVQHLFSRLDSLDTWMTDTGPGGVYTSYNNLFGYPFDLAIEPLLPVGLTQPALNLPFAVGETWQYTGGPHGGWDQGSAWAALDFAPPGEPVGCAQVEAWVTAIAPGVIIRASNGAVIQDLDGDGYEQTGWTILYMHIESRDRIPSGAKVQAGDRIGHPSCEGGFSNANHLHLARRFNGMWIPAADPILPFVLDGFVASGNQVEYDGWLTRGNQVIEAWDSSNALNQIQR
jgi:LasA protease